MTIKKKMILILFAFSVVPMLLVGICSFIYARNVIEAVRLEDFNKVADLRAKMIKDFFTELEKDIHTIASLAEIQEKTLLLANSPADLFNPKYVSFMHDACHKRVHRIKDTYRRRKKRK